MGSASALDSLNCAVSGRGEGRTIKDAPLVRETVEQLDDFAGWVKAERVERGPPVQAVLSCGKLNDGRLPDGEMSANLGERDSQAVRSARATVPIGGSADRDS